MVMHVSYITGAGRCALVNTERWCRLLWEKGAELEDSSSQYSLGVIHLGEGSLVEINVTRAQAYLEQALAGRQWKAAWLLSQLYMEDHESLGKNCTKALEYMWTFIAQTSDLSSVSQEAFEKLTGHPLTAEDRTDLIPEPFRALLLYAYLAEKGSVSAGMNAGWMLERGQGLPLSTPQGAAEQSEPLKENRVHAYGMQDFAPTTESLRLAAYYYGRAAATNHTPAMVDYANLLVNLQWALKLHGSLVIHTPQGEQLTGTQLVQKGLELYADAKARRDSEAATNLAWAHFAGVGVEQDLRRAQELYHEAAEMARDGKTGFAPLTALMLTRGLRWGLPLRAGARVASWVGGQREGGLLGRLAEWSQMVTKAIAV
jgi:TPR repeat protein